MALRIKLSERLTELRARRARLVAEVNILTDLILRLQLLLDNVTDVDEARVLTFISEGLLREPD